MKHRLIKILVVLLFFTGILSFQLIENDRYILLHGIVMDAKTREPIPNVHYVLNNSYGNITDKDGEFSLYMTRNDTIRFTYVGYQDFFFSPADTLAEEAYTAGIFMQPDTLVVGEVIIIPRLPDLKTDILSDPPRISPEVKNASNNLEIAVYQGIMNRRKLDYPRANYYRLKRQQVLDAFEEGTLPPEWMVGLNILAFPGLVGSSRAPAERPEPPRPAVSQEDVNRMKEIYQKKLKRRP